MRQWTTPLPVSAEAVAAAPAIVPDSSERRTDNTDLVDSARRLEIRMHELAELSEALAESMKRGAADPQLAETFLALWKETVRGEAVLELFREVERERQENQTLMEIAMKLSSSSSIDELLRCILDCLKQVVHFDAAGIFVYNRDLGQLEIDMLVGYENAEHEKLHKKFQQGVKLGQGIVGTVIQTGQPVYDADVRLDPRYIEARDATRSELAVPIIVRDEIIGALNLEADRIDAFSARDLRSLTTFANHAGVALERARADRLRLHTRRMQEEIELARRIQMSFLPQVTPRFDPYDLAGSNVPSSEVGGDYYDFIPITESDLGIVIGDVTGHGVGAALLMANFRACLRIESRNNFAIRTILAKVNNYLYETNVPESFVTAVYGVLDRRNHIFSYANAGHNLPLLLRRDDSVCWLTEGGLLLGAFPNVRYQETAVHLEAGDVLVFYTDGVTEACDADGMEFGLDRLLEIVRQHRNLTSAEIVRSIRRAVEEFRGDVFPQDDFTLSVVKHG